MRLRKSGISKGCLHPLRYSSEVLGYLVLVNLLASCVMAGIIWFVQHVHYPLLAQAPPDSAAGVAVEHQRRTSRVVAVPMAVEGFSTLALLVDRPNGVWWVWPWAGALLLAIALGSTVFLSVPLHGRMATHPDAQVGARLVTTNWPRTIAWSMRVVVGVIMAVQMGNFG